MTTTGPFCSFTTNAETVAGSTGPCTPTRIWSSAGTCGTAAVPGTSSGNRVGVDREAPQHGDLLLGQAGRGHHVEAVARRCTPSGSLELEQLPGRRRRIRAALRHHLERGAVGIDLGRIRAASQVSDVVLLQERHRRRPDHLAALRRRARRSRSRARPSSRIRPASSRARRRERDRRRRVVEADRQVRHRRPRPSRPPRPRSVPSVSVAGSSGALAGAEAGVTVGKPFSVCSHWSNWQSACVSAVCVAQSSGSGVPARPKSMSPVCGFTTRKVGCGAPRRRGGEIELHRRRRRVRANVRRAGAGEQPPARRDRSGDQRSRCARRVMASPARSVPAAPRTAQGHPERRRRSRRAGRHVLQHRLPVLQLLHAVLRRDRRPRSASSGSTSVVQSLSLACTFRSFEVRLSTAPSRPAT